MIWRKPVFAFTLLAVALGLFVAPVAAEPKPSNYTLPGNAVFPEGIAYQQSTGYFYVSSTTDGTIFRAHVKDEVAEVFLSGNTHDRTTAVGLAVDDRRDRLFIAGGGTGKFFVYDVNNRNLLASFDNNQGDTFVNDVVVARDGSAYFTDSRTPILYRVHTDAQGNFQLQEWLNLNGTAIQYQAGFNLNGIDVTENGKYLVVVQSNTGRLFRIDIDSQQVIQIDLGGATLPNGDGILLQGRTLYVVQNALNKIAVVRLSGDLSSGTVVSEITHPSFIFPTTVAEARGRLLVVNSQFNNMGGTPVLPFTVSVVKKH